MKFWDSLAYAVRNGTHAHAYLFSRGGDEAEEKAGELLRIFFCTADSGQRPCGICASCTYHTHPDLVSYEPSSSKEGGKEGITVADMLEFQRRLSLSPVAGSKKGGLLKQAERIGRDAQPSLLKFLEEPKGNLLLIALTEHPELLLETTRSRFQEMRFPASNPAPLENSVKTWNELEKQSLAERFVWTKKAAEREDRVIELLGDWISMAHTRMIGQGDLAREARVLSVLDEVWNDVKLSNASVRLALDRVMIEL